MELTLLYLRETGKSRYNSGHDVPLSWFGSLPTVPDSYKQRMEKVVYKPEDYLEGRYEDVFLCKCPDKRMPINIRWNGLTNLCCWGFDDRLNAGEFLGSYPKTRFNIRRYHPICIECCANNFPLYSGYVNIDEINTIARRRLPVDVPDDRILTL